MILANDEVEVFDNTIEKNQTGGLSIISYLFTGQRDQGREIRPVLRGDPCSRQSLRGQRRQTVGGKIGEMLSKVLGATLPDILYDGIVDPKKQVDGKLPPYLGTVHS